MILNEGERMMKHFFAVLILILAISGLVQGQAHEHSPVKGGYIYPADPLVQEKLESWRDLKFGFMMHWGLYAQLGIVESWPLCSEDQSFQDRGGVPYTEFKAMYFNQIREFNPLQFDPVPWARAARDAGMKYVVFTTKHHDGFCMWDTHQTEFRITGPGSPFRTHPKANIAKAIFDAFRNQGFMTGVYFSKADWHHPDYWSPLWATPDRNNNYDIRKYPEKWQSFKDFTFNQIEELMTTLGPVDILWLDGGWVRPDSTINEEVLSWGYAIPHWEQDIDIPRIAGMARSHQPGLLVVDRTVHGPYEDYRTPEQSVPDTILPYPFETCMTMAGGWGYVKKSRYKSTEQIIHTLIDIVSKGGNCLLDVGPTPQGTLESDAYQRLGEIGRWMKVNGDALYSTRPWTDFKEGDSIRFTRTKDWRYVYVFALEWPEKSLKLKSLRAKRNTKIFMLGYDTPLKWSQNESMLTVQLPAVLKEKSRHAWVFRVEVSRPENI
jgi:alpha-L-fucosidase